jgi:hypothetical protein
MLHEEVKKGFSSTSFFARFSSEFRVSCHAEHLFFRVSRNSAITRRSVLKSVMILICVSLGLIALSHHDINGGHLSFLTALRYVLHIMSAVLGDFLVQKRDYSDYFYKSSLALSKNWSLSSMLLQECLSLSTFSQVHVYHFSLSSSSFR